MPPRGLTTKAAGSAQISLNKTKQLFAAAHNIKSPKTPLRAIVAESKRAGNKAGATPVGPCLASKPGTMRRSFAPVGVRVGPARRPGEEGLEFLNVAASTKTSLQLNDAGYAMSKQTSLELARSILVFKLCSIPLVVKNSRKLYDIASKVLGEKLPDYVVGKTFFSHFCGGVSTAELVPVIGALRTSGIGAILDYAAEADVAEISAAWPPTENIVAEKACDHNAATIISAIEACAATRASIEEPTFAAVKVTGLGAPELLEKVTRIIDAFAAAHPPPPPPEDAADALLSPLLNSLPANDALAGTSATDADILSGLTRAEGDEYARVRARLEGIAQVAEVRRVMLLVDAEQTYMQRAIDHLALHAMALHNKERPVVFNTYQCYLVDTPDRVARDTHRADTEGWVFAGKMVRGAYMVQERALALKKGRPDPIHAGLEATHKCYDEVVASVLRHVAQGRAEALALSRAPADLQDPRAALRGAAGIMVASHNEKSVRLAAELLAELGVPKHGAGVYFAQLKGMCDHISFGLGARHFQVFKYVPYGPVREVMPYLLRRAEENSDIMRGASKEVNVLTRELRRRLAVTMGIVASKPWEFSRSNTAAGHSGQTA
ncbi:FAD-linked oxidoreductase-like protein [Baffinella frigidus]|nr:FAD-linked oxidoreductase-like protein [Cryptophyta sp. CCMP2293]